MICWFVVDRESNRLLFDLEKQEPKKEDAPQAKSVVATTKVARKSVNSEAKERSVIAIFNSNHFNDYWMVFL